MSDTTPQEDQADAVETARDTNSGSAGHLPHGVFGLPESRDVTLVADSIAPSTPNNLNKTGGTGATYTKNPGLGNGKQNAADANPVPSSRGTSNYGRTAGGKPGA